MSAVNKGVTLSLTVMINKERTKVLFAEAGNQFTDILLSFLTLPLGRIVKVLKEHFGAEAPTIGSCTLYHSLANLPTSYFWTEGAKFALLNPTSSFEDEYKRLKLEVSAFASPATLYFYCTKKDHNKFVSVSTYYDELSYCSSCKCLGRMSKIGKATKPNASGGGVFTINKSSFIISDDLQILPNETGVVNPLQIDEELQRVREN